MVTTYYQMNKYERNYIYSYPSPSVSCNLGNIIMIIHQWIFVFNFVNDINYIYNIPILLLCSFKGDVSQYQWIVGFATHGVGCLMTTEIVLTVPIAANIMVLPRMAATIKLLKPNISLLRLPQQSHIKTPMDSAHLAITINSWK